MNCRCGEQHKPDVQRRWIWRRVHRRAAGGKRIVLAARAVVECTACGAVWHPRKS